MHIGVITRVEAEAANNTDREEEAGAAQEGAARACPFALNRGACLYCTSYVIRQVRTLTN